MKLGYVGGLGHMAAPAAGHLMDSHVAAVVRVHDRGAEGPLREQRRQAWRRHGARLVRTIEALVGAGDLDGIVVCCGKNGDDLQLVAELGRRLGGGEGSPFLLHMSTVSADFVEAAVEYCRQRNVAYVNYPLTGGPLGAQRGGAHPHGMLILASGDRTTYERLEPVLEILGHPRFFGPRPAAAAETKLIGQHMVFCGCTGIATAAALHAECFAGGALGGAEQADYFDYLNAGAGGTRQWEVALGKGIRDGEWQQGFMVRHAVVDAIYAAQLAMHQGLPGFSVRPMLSIALAFSFLLAAHPGVELATHAVTRELVRARAPELDAFMAAHGGCAADLEQGLGQCVASLPTAVRESVRLGVTAADFDS